MKRNREIQSTTSRKFNESKQIDPSRIMAWTSRSPLDSVPWMSHSSSDTILQMQAITLKPHSKQATSLLLLINGTTAYPFAQAGNLDWFLIAFLLLRKKRFKNTGLWAPWRDTELMSGVTLSHGDPVAKGLGLEPALPISSCVTCANSLTSLWLIFINHKIGEYLPWCISED